MAYGAIVIGSGFGGAVAACRLAEAGERVLVLERGRRWQTTEFPRSSEDRWLFDVDEPEHQHGWIDLRVFRHIAVAQGAGVGGGSLIYANVSVPPEPFVFDEGWPEQITWDTLRPHFDTVGNVLNVQEIPDGQLTERYKLMRDAAQAVGDGHRLRKLPLAVRFDNNWNYESSSPGDQTRTQRQINAFGRQQGSCIHCGNCDIGCPVDARNSLDLNYLAAAEDHHAEIRPLHLVRNIEPENGRYRVHYQRLDNGETGSEVAERVIIAAGSLNSTELLLRCRDEHSSLPQLSQRLGQGWCANGDFMTTSFYDDRRVSPTHGPTITSAIDYLDGSDYGHRYFVEDGGVPDVIGNVMRAAFKRGPRANNLGTSLLYLIWKLALRGKLNNRDVFSNMMPWFGQAVDGPGGTMTLRRPWYRLHKRLMLDYDVKSSRPVVQAMINRHVQLTHATGGKAMVPPSWRWFRYLVTPHPLGGCNMGNSAAEGVVDYKGEVFGYPNLHVIDGAIVPRALGLNPSRTIAGLAENAMQEILQ